MSDKITTTTTYLASGTAIFFGMTASEFAALAGLVLGTLTFLLNAWFKYQHLELAREVARTKKEELDGYIEQ